MPDGLFGEGRLVRWTLIALAVGFLVLFLVLPLLAVFAEALRRGADAFFAIRSGGMTITSSARPIRAPLRRASRNSEDPASWRSLSCMAAVTWSAAPA